MGDRVRERRVGQSDSLNNLGMIKDLVRREAQQRQGNGRSLLELLRVLESLHQEIRDGVFQESLPDNRQALYSMLKDMEAEGGWPYIGRMKLRSLLDKLIEEPSEAEEDVTSDTEPSTQH